MDFLSVGGIKLKVILTPAECEEYGVLSIESGVHSEGVRRSVRRILDEAGRRISFSTHGERLLIQVYPLTGGGAELFITKLTAISERERRAVAGGGVLTYADGTAFYRIPDGRALAGAARALPHRLADLYRAHNGEYYLALPESLLDDSSDTDVLLEFGERIHRLPLGLTGEWGTLLLRNTELSACLP